MRQDAEPFRSRNAAPVKYPRVVAKIEFEVESIFLTSHDDIVDIPGVIIPGVLQDPSATSQRIVPDEARSEIGSFSFSFIDKDSAFTDAIRDRLQDDGYGLRGKKVKLYLGYAETIAGDVSVSDTALGAGTFGSGTFGGVGSGNTPAYTEARYGDFGLFQTQVITGASFQEGAYQISCADITREQREDIFEPKSTTLATALTDSATTVEVYDTSKFHPIAHGTSYSDSPSATVGYIQIEKEIIKYTGLTPSSFTGCTRGALNTKAVAHTFESTADEDRRPKVEEYIYLEEPCAKLAYKVLTGRDPLTGVTCWPDHWHLGFDPELVTLTDFTGIGADLWDTADDTAGFVAYFTGLKKVTGKRFLESEIYALLGCYSPIYADGTVGLKRMNQVLAESASVVTLNEDNCVSWSELRHEYGRMHNRLRIDWNWNGTAFTRSSIYLDPQSIQIHQQAPTKTYQFKGLHGARHTDAIIRQRLDCLRDRYSQPPETMSVSVLPSLNTLEIGDIVRVQLSTVRDFAGTGEYIDRSFEIQSGQYNWMTGAISFDLFGSTASATTEAITTDEASLPDAFYTDRGTELSTVATIVVTGGVGVIQPGSYTLTGHADVNHDDAVFYYDGDLQLASGATLVVEDNVQLRHNGFFQINGTIDGIGNGKAGVADSSTWQSTQEGLSGFIGNSRGQDGILGRPVGNRGVVEIVTAPCAMTLGKYSAFPYIDLAVDGNDLVGIPSDLRGTSGGAGGKAGTGTLSGFGTGTVTSNGGTGGNSGAGLVLIGKGLAFGGAGSIDLSGDDSAATSVDNNAIPGDNPVYPGSGGAGSPGGLLILVDGGSVSLPDVGGHFTALCGEVPQTGTELPERGPIPLNILKRNGWQLPGAGFADGSLISGVDLSNVAYRVQYIPAVTVAQEDQGDKPSAPTAMSGIGGIGKVVLNATVALDPGDRIEYYASASNDRTTATRVGFGALTELVYQLVTGGTRYFWARVRRVQPGVDLFSDWYPSGSTSGVNVTAASIDTTDATANAWTEVYTASGDGSAFLHTDGSSASHVINDTSNGIITNTVTATYGATLTVTGSITAVDNTGGINVIGAGDAISSIGATAGLNGSIIAEPGAFCVQKTLTLSAANSPRYMGLGAGMSVGSSITIQNIFTKLEIIKR